MYTRSLANTSLCVVRILLQVNFNASVIFVLLASLLTLTGSELFFENNSDLYGPLANNLRLVLVYLFLVQLAVYGFYQMSSNYGAIVFLGAFLLILIGALDFYCTINQIEVDENYQSLFLYAGLSHFLYGGLCLLLKKEQ